MTFGVFEIQRQRNSLGEILVILLKMLFCLDYFLISKNLNDLTDKWKILYSPETDHSAILIHIKSEEFKHKR